MRVAVLYRSSSEHERQVLDFEREFERFTGHTLDMLDVNTRDGSAMANLYDILKYPAVIAVSNEGRVQQVWDVDNGMPLINEVSYYSRGE
jgi:hypothetical protein